MVVSQPNYEEKEEAPPHFSPHLLIHLSMQIDLSS